MIELSEQIITALDDARVAKNTAVAQAIFDIGMNFLAVQEESPISEWTDFLAQDPGADWDEKKSEYRMKHHPKVGGWFNDVGAAEYRGFHVIRVFWKDLDRAWAVRWARGVEPAYFHMKQRRFATAKEFYDDDQVFNRQDRNGLLMPRTIACVHPR